MNLEITQELLLFLKEEKISIEDYFVLLALKSGEGELLEVYDNNMKDSYIYVTVYQKLFRIGYLKLSDSLTEDYFELTQKAIDLLETIKNQ